MPGDIKDGQGTTETVTTEKPADDSILGGEEVAPTETAGGETKVQETTEADPYEAVKVPEGAEVDAEFIGDTKAWAKEHKIAPEALTKLVNAWGERVKASTANAEKEASEAQAKRGKEWVTGLKADKEFGGKNYDSNVKAVKSFLTKVDPDKSFRAELIKANVTNWPPLVKFLHKLATADKDDSVAETIDTSKPSPAESEEAALDEMYPTMKKKG